jgi:class 3 adenylate cyclase
MPRTTKEQEVAETFGQQYELVRRCFAGGSDATHNEGTGGRGDLRSTVRTRPGGRHAGDGDDLLATLLPKQIVRILKSNKKLPPICYDDVSLLFCDIVGFTTYAESQPPEVVFSHLETLIEDFEKIADDFELMKVKTIGDAIMIAGGLLGDLDAPVYSTAACALEMVKAVSRHEAGWQIRIGIDHGPVVAGVIGRSRFQFDVWGDTVNTASRIQEMGAPNTVNLSGRAWQQLRTIGRGRSLGMVELKGKQSIEVVECQELRAPL